MAPAKKKKKPAANPARGFATTSVPSKPKIAKSKSSTSLSKDATSNEGTGVTSPGDEDPNVHEPSVVENAQQGKDTSGRDLHELSPAELEARLEEAELQTLVEKHAPGVKKDASKCVTKLQTECRLLRKQADPLSSSPMMNEDLLQRILTKAKADLERGHFWLAQRDEDGRAKKRVKMTEDEVALKLWRLQLVLTSLGFEDESVQDVLRWLLTVQHRISDPFGIGAIWGLEECLDWLVLNLDEADLPVIDDMTGAIKGKVDVLEFGMSASIFTLLCCASNAPSLFCYVDNVRLYVNVVMQICVVSCMSSLTFPWMLAIEGVGADLMKTTKTRI